MDTWYTKPNHLDALLADMHARDREQLGTGRVWTAAVWVTRVWVVAGLLALTYLLVAGL